MAEEKAVLLLVPSRSSSQTDSCFYVSDELIGVFVSLVPVSIVFHKDCVNKHGVRGTGALVNYAKPPLPVILTNRCVEVSCNLHSQMAILAQSWISITDFDL